MNGYFARKQGFQYEYCSKPAQLFAGDIQLDLTHWSTFINKEVLNDVVGKHQSVSLIFRRGVSLNESQSQLLANELGAKITEIQILAGTPTWKELKILLSKTSQLTSLVFHQCLWLNDTILEHISKRFNGTLAKVELVRNTAITNNGLFQLGRRCKLISILSVVCCPKVSDLGLIEISKNNSIKSLNISHSMNIGDKAIEALFLNSKELHELEFTNCGSLSDTTLSFLYEIKTASGMKKTSASSSLKKLILGDNLRFSDQSMLWISTGASHICDLTISECPSINPSKAIAELCNLKNLSRLDLGPVMCKFDPMSFIDSMAILGPNLVQLRLNGLSALKDEHIASVIEQCLDLQQLHLINMDFGTATTESICSNVPNVSLLELAGSSIFQDIDLRCICSTMLNLKHLKVAECAKLSDAGYTRLISLRKLTTLDIANNSKKCSGSIIKFFSLCPLTSLSLKGLSFMNIDTLECLKGCTRQTLKRLCLNMCNKLSSGFVKSALETFVGCEEMDFTSSIDEELEHVSQLQHFNPFLRWNYTHEFAGFQLIESNGDKFYQYWAAVRCLRRHYGARLLQRLWKKHKNKIEMLKLLRRELWNEFKIMQLIKIQSLVRGFLARRMTKRQRYLSRLIANVVLSFVLRQRFLKLRMAVRHYDRVLKEKSMASLRNYAADSRKDLHRQGLRAESVYHKFLKKKLLNMMKDIHKILKARALEDSASIMWEINMFRAIFRGWRKTISETSTRRQLLCKVFLVSVSLNNWNSSRQLRLVSVADNFRNNRLMLLAWVTIARDRLDNRRIEQLVPVAIEHFQKSFFNRVCGNCFQGFILYRKFKIQKRENMAKAAMHVVTYAQQNCFRMQNRYIKRRLIERQMLSKANDKWLITAKKRCLNNRMPMFVAFNLYFKTLAKKSDVHRRKYLHDHGYHRLKMGILEQRRFRELQIKSVQLYQTNLIKKTFKGWDLFRNFSKTLDVLYYQRYLVKLQKKVLYGLRLNVALNKEAIRSVTLTLMHRAGDEHRYNDAIEKVKYFQARCRGNLVRRKFQETKIQKLYSIQVLQNFFRTMLARKEYLSRYKKSLIAQKVQEDLELDRMRDAELEMRYFMYQENAIIDIQRAFRGWLGRRKFAERATEHFREKSKQYYEDNEHFRVHHEAFKRAALAREQLRHRAATDIQRIVRGRLGRKKFKEVEQLAKIAKFAVHLQRAYRKRLAMLKLDALRRDQLSELRYKAARRQRGLLLRLVGLFKRKQQFRFAPVMEGLGIDPITYNYRITELVTETINDFKHIVSIFYREKALYSEHGLNRLNLSLGRRQVLANQGWKFNAQDAVRIVELGHKFEGYTGTIVRIDETLLGAPLFEVRLDRFPRQTFVRMTTDPLIIYAKTQALAKIMSRPEMGEQMDRFRIFPHDHDVTISKKSVYAAWTIQRAYRTHRARKIVAHKRYEHWMQNIARQWSLLYHLADSNSLNTQGYNVAYFLGTRSFKPPFFDEIRHKIVPGRLTANVSKPNEARVINKEFDMRYKDRVKYLQKSSFLPGKDPFAIGYERMTFQRKLSLFMNVSLAAISKQGLALKDLFGSRGAKFLSKKGTMVTGTDKYGFRQFQNSSHVRYYKTSLYQGEWTGIPLFTPLKPHGEGVVVFLDAWGFAKEDKVLYLTILRCRHLNVMDVTSSDPYCDIFCNGTNLQTSVKWRNLNPQFHESFEIDVTNPLAQLNIQVKDKDYLGADDFMGQIVLDLNDFADGEVHQQVYQLKGEDVTIPEDFDRGEIEVRIRWAERIFEDDQARIDMQRRMIVRIQAWARRIAALMLLRALRKERVEKLLIVKRSAIKITNTCRIRLARKEYKRRMRKHKAAIKIQKRVRIWIAKRVVKEKRLRWQMAIRIQTQARVYLAKEFVRKLKEQMAADMYRTVTVIQKYVRRWIAMKWRLNQLGELAKAKELAIEQGEILTDEKVSDWLATYGVDPEYGLKRNRRITERLFAKMLKTRFVRVISRFGIVYIDSYPPRKTEEEQLQELQGGTHESLTNRDEFVSVFLPTFQPIAVRRAKAIEQFHRYNHTAVLHLPSSVSLKKSVHYLVTTIQCAQRQRVARMQYAKMLRVHKAIALFQKIFRRRYERQHKAAVKIIALFRMIKSKKKTNKQRVEKKSAIIIQCAYRSFKARSAMFDLRSVEKLSVLRSTDSLPLHGAEKSLEHRSDTFWVAESCDKAEVRVEFGKAENIVEIWIMTSTFQASPNFVQIFVTRDKKKGYEEIVERSELPLLVGERWHFFPIPVVSAKYFMLTFSGNYGDDKYISVRQIRFIRSKESSARIIKQPSQFILDPGPTVGEESELVLRCEATGWPLPTYQWYRNGELLDGETNSELKINLLCHESGTRTYRCIRCKMVSRSLPLNAFHVKCGNCGYQFVFKEVEDYDKQIIALRGEEQDLHQTKTGLQASKIQMESFNNPKYKSLLIDLEERLAIIEERLQKLREARYHAKQNVTNVNIFSSEGIYTCMVQNIRGGSLKIKRKSISSVVVVEKPNPYIVEVHPYYVPRQQMKRKKWNIYSSILGTFRNGRIEGIVLIRYIDGSFYEGPFISEDAVDFFGKTRPEFKSPNHYGIYRLVDGRIFEGANVDNHFDVNNLQSFYRLTFPNGEVYEGAFVDENYHGSGMFSYKDGSVYEGQWHRGTRFGHGHFRSSEGWTYEGFFDKDRRHRQGVIDWPDGSCYMGDWYYDKIQGKGIFITPLRDVYKGEMQEGKFNGHGEIIYADGSTYVGEFKDGKRHGKGIFIEREGTEYFGHFEDDLRQGEHVVKVTIPIEEIGQDNYEIRIGVYENGNLVKWKSKFSNPIATKQFISLFKQNREMFDSVFSMMLAKNLPNLPEGIDGNNPQVKAIVFKIRTEAGMLVGQHALNQAQSQLEALFGPLGYKNEEVESLKKEIENYSMNIITLEKESSEFFTKFSNLISKYEKETSKIEQHWLDEPTQVRAIFRAACKKLDTITVDEYFAFRNHRVVPVFVKKIFDAISYLLNISTDWSVQQMIIADSLANSRSGDEEALRLDYKCKLSYMMKDYRVYDYVHIKQIDELYKIFCDVRFRSDSYYIESTGPPGPVLVEWIKANFAYIRAAERMYTILNAAEEKRVEAFRFKALHVKKKEEIVDLTKRLEATRKKLNLAQLELQDLQHAVLKANDLLQFIAGRYNYGQSQAKQDYYKLLEQKMEEKKDRFTIEVCLRGMVDKVIERIDTEKKNAMFQAIATGKKYEEPVLIQGNLLEWIKEEVISQQASILETGRTLGYSFEPETTDVSVNYTTQIVSLIVDIVTSKLNDCLNDLASAKSWTSRKGKKISSRFLYILTWKVWKEEALKKRDAIAMLAWENIFGDPFTCAIMAIEARLSHRMSSIARAQGKVWADHHKAEIETAESYLSDEFGKDFESIEAAAQSVIEIENDTADTFAPAVRAKAACWAKYHPDEMRGARDQHNIQYAQAFEDHFKDETSAVCFKIISGLANEEEMEWADYAQHWKDFHVEQYDKASDAIINEMAKDFVDAYPLSTYYEAAKMIENDRLSKYIIDDEVRAEYAANPKLLMNAFCWGVKNQGMLRKGRELLYAENRNNFSRLWNDFMLQTENGSKGSVLYTVLDENGQDRFLGFRNRLANKFAWVYGFLCRRAEILSKDLQDLDLNDPLEKILHRVRPSEFTKTAQTTEERFLEVKRKVESEYEEIIEKISAWNTYFGMGQT